MCSRVCAYIYVRIRGVRPVSTRRVRSRRKRRSGVKQLGKNGESVGILRYLARLEGSKFGIIRRARGFILRLSSVYLADIRFLIRAIVSCRSMRFFALSSRTGVKRDARFLGHGVRGLISRIKRRNL